MKSRIQTPSTRIITGIRGLGFIGILVSGSHHLRHDLAIAKGHAGKPTTQNCSKSGNPLKWRSRANPGRSNQRSGWESIETRRAAPDTRCQIRTR